MVFVTTIITPTACNGEIGAVTAPANAPIRAAWQGRSAIRASVRLPLRRTSGESAPKRP